MQVPNRRFNFRLLARLTLSLTLVVVPITSTAITSTASAKSPSDSMPALAPSFRTADHSAALQTASPQPALQTAAPQTAAGVPGSKMLYGQVGASEVLTGAVKQQLGLRTGASADGTNLVAGVKDGSAAFRAGLQVGDLIVEADRQNDVISLSVERDGERKNFKLLLQSDGEPQFGLRLPRPDNSASKPQFNLNAEHLASIVDRSDMPMFAAKVSDTARLLSRYDIDVIVDASMSMRKRDCPGFMSRWDWCGVQSVQLARQLAPFASQGISLTSFNRNFDVYEHQNPSQITALFAHTPLALSTRLAEPLADRLNDYLIKQDSARPRLIAVITDGVPRPMEQPKMVINVLLHAANTVKDPRRLTVVFFQIGSRDMLGQQFLSEIDNNLMARGARFDIVQSVSFEHLQQVGLAQGLADAIKRFDNKIRQ